jgi:hypothetical protein
MQNCNKIDNVKGKHHFGDLDEDRRIIGLKT